MCLFRTSYEPQEVGRPKPNAEGSLSLPCGKCTECVSKRSIEWATRCKHEISLHKENCFLTLTYDQDNLPSPFIVKHEFQKFLKRLRKHTKLPLRYIVSHEYGSQTNRPHHHAIIFGWNPPEQTLLSMNKGNPLFRSKILEKLWTHGHSSIGTANEKTAYYIASYSLKGKKHQVTHPETGEIVTVKDSMDASKRPAIGYQFFLKNINQQINSDKPLPRYYKKILQQHQELKDNESEIKKNLNHEDEKKRKQAQRQLIKLKFLSQYIQTQDLIDLENKTLLSIKNRENYQIYSKFIIAKQKNKTSSEYRTAPDTQKEDYYYKQWLKSQLTN